MSALQVLEAAGTLERERQLVVVADLDGDYFVAAEAQVVERPEEFLGVSEEVADHEDDAAPRDALGNLVEDAGHVGLAAGLQRVEPLQDAAHLRGLGLGGDEVADSRVVGGEAHGVLLVDEQVGERRGDVLAVLELREAASRGAPAVAHRAGGVEDDRRAQVGLVDVLLDVEALAASGEAPVEGARVVARDVSAVLGELGAGALPGALVAPGDEAVDGAVREELDSGELPQRRVRQPLHVSRQRHLRPPGEL